MPSSMIKQCNFFMVIANILKVTLVHIFLSLTCLRFRVLAIIRPPGVVTPFRHSAMFAGEHQSIGAVVLNLLAIIALPELVAVLVIRCHSGLCLAGVLNRPGEGCGYKG